MTFTHLDEKLHPTMVDVGDKAATKRSATAEARVLGREFRRKVHTAFGQFPATGPCPRLYLRIENRWHSHLLGGHR